MYWADHLLNFAALLLWLGFRGIGMGTPVTPVRAGLAGRLGWGTALVLLLGGRAWFYWRMGAELRWVPWLNLGVTAIPFNSLILQRMWVYSVCSFAVWWGTFHCGLNLLSMLTHSRRDKDPWAAWVAAQLGPFSRLPALFKPLLPWGVVALGWLAAQPRLTAIGVLACPVQADRVWQQGLVLGATTVVAGLTCLTPFLLIHFTNLIAHLGSGRWLASTELVATRATRPLRWLPLTIGGVDLASAVLATVLLVGNWFALSGLGRLFRWLEVT